MVPVVFRVARLSKTNLRAVSSTSSTPYGFLILVLLVLWFVTWVPSSFLLNSKSTAAHSAFIFILSLCRLLGRTALLNVLVAF